MCFDCSKKQKRMTSTNILPVWIDENETVHFNLPKELKYLRPGEKMLIQLLSTHIPLVMLKYGQVGLSGHVCSFPQDVQHVCTVLPRLPKQIELVKVIKKYKVGSGKDSENDTFTDTFIVRRTVVLAALKWLKLHNSEYKHVTINESNLDWMGNNEELELPCEGDNAMTVTLIEQAEESTEEDFGPVQENNATNEHGCFGMVTKTFVNQPNEKNKQITDTLKMAAQAGNQKNKVTDSLHYPIFFSNELT